MLEIAWSEDTNSRLFRAPRACLGSNRWKREREDDILIFAAPVVVGGLLRPCLKGSKMPSLATQLLADPQESGSRFLISVSDAMKCHPY